MISSTLTIIGILVADIIYALVDPESHLPRSHDR